MLDGYKGLSREARLLIYSGILPSVAYGMFYTDISYFLTSIQGLSYEFMGLIVTAMGVSTFAASVPLGIAADKFGRKNMLIAGTLIAGIIIAVFALTKDPAVLLTAAIFEGISEAALSASSGAWLAEKVACGQRNSAFSLFGFAQSVAYGIGSIIIPGVVVFQWLGFTNGSGHVLLYATVGILSLFSVLILFKVKEASRQSSSQISSEVKQPTPKESRSILFKYVFTSAIIAFGAGMVVPLMTAWLNLRYGIPDSVSGPILGVTSIVIGVSSLAAPPIARRIGLVKAIVVLQASSTIFMFTTPLFPNYASASTVYTMRAFLMNMASPLSQSMIMGLVAEKQRGAASGINAALWRLPNALSTFVGAFLMARGQLALPFFIASFLYSLSIGLFWLFFRKTKMPEEQTS